MRVEVGIFNFKLSPKKDLSYRFPDESLRDENYIRGVESRKKVL
jgi:hypothetical protein